MSVKIFLSWSGEKSGKLAEQLKNWLPAVIQAADIYYSPEDIEKGTRWNSDISNELDDSNVGLLCLTRENLSAPWLIFEAGALSKRVGESRVCPILFGLEPTDVGGPLQQFQAAKFNQEEMRRVVRMINVAQGEAVVSEQILERTFESLWPDFQVDIHSLLDADDESETPVRNTNEMVAEVLDLSRAIQAALVTQSQTDNIRKLAEAYRQLVSTVLEDENFLSVEILESLQTLHQPTNILVGQISPSTSRGRNIRIVMDQIAKLLSDRVIQYRENDFDDIPF